MPGRARPSLAGERHLPKRCVRRSADALQDGGAPTLDLGRELSLAMALQFPAHEAQDVLQGSPAVRPAAGSPVSRVRFPVA